MFFSIRMYYCSIRIDQVPIYHRYPRSKIHRGTPQQRQQEHVHPQISKPVSALPASSWKTPASENYVQINHPERIVLKPSLSHTQQTVFLGESSPLTCVIDEGRTRSPDKGYANEISKTRLHYPIPERLDANTTRDETLRAHKSTMKEQLTRSGVFSFPSKDIRESLLQAYFTWFHPCFPILDRKAIHDTYKNETIPPLLLQSMLFIGVSLCPDTTFAKIGFPTRYCAKVLFHSRARAIYDADWESNKITKLQTLFLLSFWRGGPNEERDTRFWLEVGICLAQKRGMHVMYVFLPDRRRGC